MEAPRSREPTSNVRNPPAKRDNTSRPLPLTRSYALSPSATCPGPIGPMSFSEGNVHAPPAGVKNVVVYPQRQDKTRSRLGGYATLQRTMDAFTS